MRYEKKVKKPVRSLSVDELRAVRGGYTLAARIDKSSPILARP